MRFQESKYISIIWLSFLIIIAILAFTITSDSDFEAISLFVISIHSIIVLLVLVNLSRRIQAIFILAFLARLLFMFWDIYARNIFELPNSGADTEMYYHIALKESNNLSLLWLPNRGGIYSKILGTLFYFIGPQRMIAQYINVLVGVMVVFMVYKILYILEIRSTITYRITILAALFPNSLIMSAILLREIIPTYFVAVSLYHFIRWYKWGSVLNIILSLVFLGLASVFHSGVLGIFVGYTFFYMFYSKIGSRFTFNLKSIFVFSLISGIVFLASTQFGDAMFGKFKKNGEFEDIYSTANTRLGNSAYLTGIEIKSIPQLIIYGPIKMFYFLTSPLPMNWRGVIDIFTFIFDSSLYLITLLYIYKNWKHFDEKKPLIIGLILTILCVAFIFGIGVGNAGTAVRHRQKIIPLMLVVLGVMMNENYRFKERFNNLRKSNWQEI